MSERSGGRERSKQSGASKRVSGVSEQANGQASGPVLTSLFLFVPDHSAAAFQVDCVSTQFPVVNLKGLGFYLITSCLPTYQYTELETRCQFPAYDEDLLFYLPVRVGEKHYRNAFCALCHQETVQASDFWRLTLKGAGHDDCLDALERVKSDVRVENLMKLTESRLCQARGVAHPGRDLWQGARRLGKICLHATEFRGFDVDPQPAPKGPSLVLLHHDRTQVLDSSCFCAECNAQALAKYVLTDMAKIARFVTNYENHYLLIDRVAGKGFVHTLFQHFPSKSEDNDAERDGKRKKSTLLAISLSGSGTSLVSLGSIVGHIAWTKGIASKAKRSQLGVVLAKMVFFSALCLGTATRRWAGACVFFALALHYSLLVSFCHMMWFGGQVAFLLWQLNNNMAVLAMENREKTMSKWEIGCIASFWLGPLFLVVALFCVGKFYDDSLVRYGKDDHCLLAGRFGQLYFLVLPSILMVVVNVGSVVFSLVQFCYLWDKPLDTKMLAHLTKVFARLMAFQSVQFVFGILYFFTGNDVIKLFFEFLVSFEGNFIALSYFSRFFNRLCSLNRV